MGTAILTADAWRSLVGASTIGAPAVGGFRSVVTLALHGCSPRAPSGPRAAIVMEVTLTLPFIVTCGVLLAGIVTAWALQQYTVKDLRRELDDVKTREASVAPKLATAVDNVATLCREVIEWKHEDHQALEDVKRKATRNSKRLDALEQAHQKELRDELLAAGVPEKLADKIDAVGSWGKHDISGEHPAPVKGGSR